MEFIISVVIIGIAVYLLSSRISKIEDKLEVFLEQNKIGSGELKSLKSGLIENKKKFSVGEVAYPKIAEKIKKDRFKREYNIGAKIVPAIGILSVLLGASFFLKYSFDHNIIGETGRVILGFILGMVFIALGKMLNKKFSGYSVMVTGGGFAILYLAAKFGMVYDLYSNTVGFILMTTITASAVAISYFLNSRIISFIALMGGFLVPILVSTGHANEIVLFNYILMLLIGMGFLAWKKGWTPLITGSMIGTISLYTGSFYKYYTNSEFGIYWTYLLIFFAIFTLAPFLFYFGKKSKYRIFNYMNLILPVVAGGIFMLVSHVMFKKMAWENEFFKDLYFISGLILAIFYIALSKLSLQKFKVTGDRKPVYVFIAMAAFAVLMIPALQFSGKWITFSWFIEALVLAAIAFKTKTRVFMNIATAVLGVAIGRLWIKDSNIQIEEYNENLERMTTIFTSVFNERTLIFGVAVVVIFAVAYMALKNNRRIIARVLGITGNLLVLLWISIELSSNRSAGYLSSDTASVLQSVIYLAYASIMIYIGVRKGWAWFRIFGASIFGFVIIKAYLIDIWNLSEIWRIVAFMFLGFVLLGAGFYYTKNKEKIKQFLTN